MIEIYRIKSGLVSELNISIAIVNSLIKFKNN